MAILDLTGRLGNELTAGQRAHYWFDACGKRFGYCYIRKNGCSAFKNLITETSQQQSFETFGGTPLQFMNAYHKIEDYQYFDDCDHTILVYRDPYLRLVSAYANKFVARIGNKGIFKSYRKTMRSDPEKATFREFVSDYCKNFADKDPHIRPQLYHCLPIKYDLVIELNDLFDVMRGEVGQNLAEKYFAKKNNKTTYDDKVESNDNVVDCTSDTLHRQYAKTKVVPKKEAFFAKDLDRIVKRRYALDFEIISEIERPQSKDFVRGFKWLGKFM